MTFSGVLVIGNHEIIVKKKIKIKKNKLSDFFKKKIIFGNLYARITEMLKFLKSFNFFTMKSDIRADLYFTINSYQQVTIYFQTHLYQGTFRYEAYPCRISPEKVHFI